MRSGDLFHLVRPSEVGGPRERGISAGPEGFVHLCYGRDVGTVQRRHFGGGAIVALHVDVALLDAGALRDEDLYGHGAYPHYYGAIPREAIVGEVAVAAV